MIRPWEETATALHAHLKKAHKDAVQELNARLKAPWYKRWGLKITFNWHPTEWRRLQTELSNFKVQLDNSPHEPESLAETWQNLCQQINAPKTSNKHWYKKWFNNTQQQVNNLLSAFKDDLQAELTEIPPYLEICLIYLEHLLELRNLCDGDEQEDKKLAKIQALTLLCTNQYLFLLHNAPDWIKHFPLELGNTIIDPSVAKSKLVQALQKYKIARIWQIFISHKNFRISAYLNSTSGLIKQYDQNQQALHSYKHSREHDAILNGEQSFVVERFGVLQQKYIYESHDLQNGHMTNLLSVEPEIANLNNYLTHSAIKISEPQFDATQTILRQWRTSSNLSLKTSFQDLAKKAEFQQQEIDSCFKTGNIKSRRVHNDYHHREDDYLNIMDSRIDSASQAIEDDIPELQDSLEAHNRARSIKSLDGRRI